MNPLIRRGAKAKPRRILEVKDLVKDDLLVLAKKRDTPLVARMRDSHHMVARLFALGLRPERIAETCGYSRSRILVFAQDPAFKELIAHYRELVTQEVKEVTQDFISIATSNMMKAERMLADKLDEADAADELLSVRELTAIVADRADRVGFGKKQTNVNVNVDFAAKLESAIARSGKVLELKPGAPVGARPTAALPSTLLPPASSIPQVTNAPSETPGVETVGEAKSSPTSFRRAV